jgi:hypothetical protein
MPEQGQRGAFVGRQVNALDNDWRRVSVCSTWPSASSKSPATR